MKILIRIRVWWCTHFHKHLHYSIPKSLAGGRIYQCMRCGIRPCSYDED